MGCESEEMERRRVLVRKSAPNLFLTLEDCMLTLGDAMGGDDTRSVFGGDSGTCCREGEFWADSVRGESGGGESLGGSVGCSLVVRFCTSTSSSCYLISDVFQT